MPSSRNSASYVLVYVNAHNTCHVKQRPHFLTIAPAPRCMHCCHKTGTQSRGHEGTFLGLLPKQSYKPPKLKHYKWSFGWFYDVIVKAPAELQSPPIENFVATVLRAPIKQSPGSIIVGSGLETNCVMSNWRSWKFRFSVVGKIATRNPGS